MEVNEEALRTFWYWIQERHQIHMAKELGEPKPWTNDPILQQWKFCNPFRENDKQTRWLLANVLDPNCDEDRSLLLFNIFAFRAFNWYPTYDLLRDARPLIDAWDMDQMISILQDRPETKLISNAYMIKGMQGMAKVISIPLVLRNIWKAKETLTQVICEGNSIEQAHEQILYQKFYGWGPFTSYQVVLDLMYTPLLEGAYDAEDWCAFGPGAKRGLRLIYPTLKLTQKNMVSACKDLTDQSVDELEFTPEMDIHDIEFSLCELSKYWRIKHGGKGKEKYAGT